MLFDPDDELSPAPKGLQESYCEFIERFDGAGWDSVRTRLKNWVCSYPDGDADDFRGRLTEQASSPFWGAYWELYLYYLLQAHGCDAACHPEVEDSSSRPDFIVNALGKEPFYLEAKFLEEQKDFERAKRLSSRLVRGINEHVSNPGIGVTVVVESVGEKELSVRKAADAVSRWLLKLDPDRVAAYSNSQSAYSPKTLCWPTVPTSANSGWRLVFTPFVKSDRNPNGDVVLATICADAALMPDATDLRGAIMKKYGKYGTTLSRPFVLAVAADRPSLDEDAVRRALYGINDQTDGVWSRDGSPRGRSLSAVIVAKHVRFDSVDSAKLEIWINPWANRPCQFRLRNADVVEMSNGRLVRSVAKSSNHEVFGLPSGWPIT